MSSSIVTREVAHIVLMTGLYPHNIFPENHLSIKPCLYAASLRQNFKDKHPLGSYCNVKLGTCDLCTIVFNWKDREGLESRLH